MAYEQHGADFSGVEDIDFSLSIVTGRVALAQSLARRLRTRTGLLLDDPSYGDDMRQLVGSTIGDDEIIQRVTAQCLADERVEDVEVIVLRTGNTIDLTIIIDDGDGPFRMVVAVSASTVELLEVEN
jgi:hypothetical protein